MSAKSHFSRMRALRSGGWLARLNSDEIAMLLTYEEFSESSTSLSKVFPSILAEAMGHRQESHVSRVRAKLIAHGLISIENPGGGRGNPPTVKMLPPPSRQQDIFPIQVGGGLEFVNPTKNSPKPHQNHTVNPTKIIDKPHQNPILLNSINQLNTSTNGRKGYSFAEPDSENPVLQLEGWELSGLSEILQTDRFRKAYAEWIIGLRQQGKKLTPMVNRKQISFLTGLGHGAAVESVETSTRNGYSGIYESKSGGRKIEPPVRVSNKEAKWVDQ